MICSKVACKELQQCDSKNRRVRWVVYWLSRKQDLQIPLCISGSNDVGCSQTYVFKCAMPCDWSCSHKGGFWLCYGCCCITVDTIRAEARCVLPSENGGQSVPSCVLCQTLVSVPTYFGLWLAFRPKTPVTIAARAYVSVVTQWCAD